MHIKLLSMCLLLILAGCQKNEKVADDQISLTQDSDVLDPEDPLLPAHPIVDFTWASGDIEVMFDHSLSVNYELRDRCIYFFPYSFDDNQKFIEWQIDTLKCKKGLDLSREFAETQSPVIGEKFADVELEGDSILVFKYKKEGWVMKMNQVCNQEIFPSRFRKLSSLR